MTEETAEKFSSVTVDELCGRASATPEGYNRVIASDADGTLWHGDVGDALFLQIANERDFRGEGLTALTSAAKRFLSAETVDQLEIAQGLLALCANGKLSFEVMYTLQAVSVADRPVAELEARYGRVATEFAQRVRPEVKSLLRELSREGFAVHVVTASLGGLVRAVIAHAELPVDRVSGGELTVEEGWARAVLSSKIPVFHGKTEALTLAGDWPPTLGLGDGAWDADFLSGCHLPVLVAPSAGLLSAMKTHPRVSCLTLTNV